MDENLHFWQAVKRCNVIGMYIFEREDPRNFLVPEGLLQCTRNSCIKWQLE